MKLMLHRNLFELQINVEQKQNHRILLLPKMVNQSNKSLISPRNKKKGSSGIWTRDLSHPKRESYP